MTSQNVSDLPNPLTVLIEDGEFKRFLNFYTIIFRLFLFSSLKHNYAENASKM